MSEPVPEQPYTCGAEVCEARFRIELHRIQHIRAFHPELLPFKCDLCGIKCETQTSITRHIHNKHVKKKNKKGAKSVKHPKKSSLAKSSLAIVSSANTEKAIAKWRHKVEMASLRYALVHGKHKAQLRFASLHPELKIGWRRLTELIAKYKSEDSLKKYVKGMRLLKKGKYRERSKTIIPQSTRVECGIFAITHGVDKAQWAFTLKYPNYVFSCPSVRNWWEAEKMKLNVAKNEEFDEEFKSFLNGALLDHKDLTIGDVEIGVKEFVENQTMLEVSCDNVVEEWLHAINSQIHDKTKPQLLKCACGNAYKTKQELLKHKPKCWIPDFSQDDQNRSQRACRMRPAAQSEAETISDSNSDTSSVVDLAKEVYQCPECDYSTHFESRIKRHAKSHSKTRPDKGSHKPKILETVSSDNTPEVFMLKTCRKCGFKHVSLAGLREHYRVAHDIHYADDGKETSLHCVKCSDTFLTYPGLREHVCGLRQVKLEFQPIQPRVPSNITLGTASWSLVFLCPRCVTRFDSMLELQEHHSAKTCTKVKLYA